MVETMRLRFRRRIVAEVERLHLGEGDTLLVNLEQRQATAEQIARIRAAFVDELGVPVIVTTGLTFKVISMRDLPEPDPMTMRASVVSSDER